MTSLRDFTYARVALGITGASLPTAPLLDLRLAHARARDAVHIPLDIPSLGQQLTGQGWPWLYVRSAAKDREEYLRDPDRGRRLDTESAKRLETHSKTRPIVFVLGDGLSAVAVERHGVPLLVEVFRSLRFTPTLEEPLVIAEQARVALGDGIGSVMKADLTVMFIGERPGLSSPDSLGIYLTWNPEIGRTDAERNCISNIHANGLSCHAASVKLCFLIQEARQRKLTGVALKDTSSSVLLPVPPG